MYDVRAMATLPRASEAVRTEWLRRVQAEYTSASVTQHLGLWLLQIGASPDLVKMALRIVTDEIEHARLSHVTYVRAAGKDAPALARERLGLDRIADGPLERDVARAAIRVFCLGETVAVPLFRRLREGCTVTAARRALDRILRDEVRHRDFGWLLLDWLLAQPFGAEVRAVASAELPAMFGRVAEQYALVGADLTVEVDPDERAWGLMSAREYASAVERTLERDWIARFSQRGIDAAAAWERGVAPLLRGESATPRRES